MSSCGVGCGQQLANISTTTTTTTTSLSSCIEQVENINDIDIYLGVKVATIAIDQYTIVYNSNISSEWSEQSS